MPIRALEQEAIEQSREQLDPDRVAYYLEHLDAAEPVTVFDLGGRLLLADGYHRLAAAQRLRRTTIVAEVRHGTPRDAIDFAIELACRQRGLTRRQVVAAVQRRAARRSAAELILAHRH